MSIPEAIYAQLQERGLDAFDETSLREALEVHAPTYTLIKLAPWPARRWKCQYRLMMGESMYDAQTVSEAYALGLLALLNVPSSSNDT
jgi:hypothetical protein